jgi:hypothetical protein
MDGDESDDSSFTEEGTETGTPAEDQHEHERTQEQEQEEDEDRLVMNGGAGIPIGTVRSFSSRLE